MSVIYEAALLLQKMFSQSSTFQSACGGSVNQAASHVYIGGFPSIEQQTAYPRPLFVISLLDYRPHMIAGGDRNQLRAAGAFEYYGIRNTNPSFIVGDVCDYTAASLDHYEFFGSVLDEISELAGYDDNLNVTNIVQTGIAEVDAKFWPNLGRFYHSTGIIYWGDENRMRM